MMDTLWFGVLFVSGIWLVALSVVVFIRPDVAERFLNLFANSVTAHWVEQLLRLLAGVALWFYAPDMWMAGAFRVFGGIILVTAVVLLILPWRWHQRFARWAVPLVLGHLTLYALGALVIGCWVLGCCLRSKQAFFQVTSHELHVTAAGPPAPGRRPKSLTSCAAWF